MLRSVIAVLLVLTPFLEGVSAQPTEADLEWFEQEVRPLLAKRCLACHGPDRQRSGLRLDHIQTILEGGERGPALVLGDPDASLLVGAVRYDDPDLQMPPSRKLASEDLATLQEWVRRGAPWPDEPPPAANVEAEVFDLAARRAEHWAWQPLTAPPVPGAEPADDSAAIDAFIRSELEEAGLEQAPVAEPEILVRRLSFALRGLPPSPDEVDAFLRDGRVDAWERLVDRWLASPHPGERWGRHWLGLMRYAETHGHEFDYPIPEAWRYRDYVIRAFNADVPYDQFLREHVAGDLLPDPRRHPEEHFNESIIATGFWHLYQAHHGPVDVRADEAERVANQIAVFSKTFLGLTVACARCHDHKFDAISTADYYALSGYLQSSRRQYAHLDPRGRIRSATEAIESVREEAARAQERLTLPSDAAGALVVASGRLREAAGRRPFDPETSGSLPVTAWERALEDSRVQAPGHPLHSWYSSRWRMDSATTVASPKRSRAGATADRSRIRAEIHLQTTRLRRPRLRRMPRSSRTGASAAGLGTAWASPTTEAGAATARGVASGPRHRTAGSSPTAIRARCARPRSRSPGSTSTIDWQARRAGSA